MMRMRSVHSDRVDRTIDSDAAGKSLDRFNRIFPIEVDDLGPLVLRHFQAGRNRINSEDAASIQELRACNHELTDGSAAKYSNCTAGVDACDLCRHPGSGDDVRD